MTFSVSARLLTAALTAALVAATLVTAPTGPGAVASAHAPAAGPGRAVVETRLLGTSVEKRRIFAYRLGESGKRRMVLIATMHGNEGASRQILKALMRGPKIRGLDLWVVPTYNPDGYAAHTRKNAHGVDLNRNFPWNWVDLDGNYESGPKPKSEPETKAMIAFLRDIKPRRILSFHQPLRGVDTDTKLPKFARRVARALRLPTKKLDCGGVCHGTMTGWYNHKFDGAAVTVEYGAHPGRRLMRKKAPGQILRVLGGTRG
jgi:murein peptide amidase A